MKVSETLLLMGFSPVERGYKGFWILCFCQFSKGLKGIFKTVLKRDCRGFQPVLLIHVLPSSFFFISCGFSQRGMLISRGCRQWLILFLSEMNRTYILISNCHLKNVGLTGIRSINSLIQVLQLNNHDHRVLLIVCWKKLYLTT